MNKWMPTIHSLQPSFTGFFFPLLQTMLGMGGDRAIRPQEKTELVAFMRQL